MQLIKRLILLLITVAALSGVIACSSAPPPPPPHEVRSVKPAKKARWLGGHWKWVGKRQVHVWVPGHWVVH